MGNQTPAFVRTLVPMVVGYIASFLLTRDIHLSDDQAAQLGALLTLVIGYVYYAVVKLVETKYPKFGYLLGIARKPNYQGVK